MHPNKPPPELPQELVDSILEHVHDDLSALYNCSFVSHSWRYSSQTLIFRNLRLRMGNAAGCKEPSSFLSFLQGHPRCYCIVRSVALTFVMGAPLDLPILRQILVSLPALDALQLSWEHINFGEMEPPPSSQLFKLKSLTLIEFGPSPHPYLDMSIILSSFYAIDLLRIEYPSVTNGVESTSHVPDWVTKFEPPCPAQIHSLVLEIAKGATHTPLKLLRRHSGALSSLAVRCSHASTVYELGELLRQVGTCLSHLELDASAHHPESQRTLREILPSTHRICQSNSLYER